MTDHSELMRLAEMLKRNLASPMGGPDDEDDSPGFICIDAPEATLIENAIRQLAERAGEALGVPEKYDDVLLPFVVMMRAELHANAGKGDRHGWLRMSADTCLLEIYYHLAKLQKVVRKDSGNAICEYAADVANLAMMLVDICGGLSAAPTPEAQQGERRHVNVASIGHVSHDRSTLAAAVFKAGKPQANPSGGET